MTSRYEGPIRFFITGDENRAGPYKQIARKLAGYLRDTSRLTGDPAWQGVRRLRFNDGASVVVHKVGALIYNAYVQIPESVAGVREALQYQFVYTGGAAKQWTVEQAASKFSYVGGSAVGVVFLLREDNSVSYAVEPLVSSILEPPDNEWVYVPSLIAPGAVSAWVNSLIVPRYEIVHASSQPLSQPDFENTVFASWMPKGERHYMASAFNVGSLRQSGTLNSTVVQFQPGYFGLSHIDFPEPGFENTDIGYEVSLERYNTPLVEASELQVVKGSAEKSAPDADWYSSYGVQRVTLADGSVREFGIMVDAAQTVHVWPLEAAGTGTPNPAYASQLIKTNVAQQYVRTAQLQFPAGVYVSTLSYRDTFTDAEDYNPFIGGPLQDATRYIWSPRHDGTRFCSIVERIVELGVPWSYMENRFIEEAGPPTSFGSEYRCSNPAVAWFEISISATSSSLSTFSIEVTPVELLEVADGFYPVQAKYALDTSFPGVDKGELLVGGFSARRLSTSVDSWEITVAMNSLDFSNPIVTSAILDARLMFNCNALLTPALPVAFPGVAYQYLDVANGSIYDPVTGFVTAANFMYAYEMPRYAVQDFPFTRLGVLPDGVRSNGNPFNLGQEERTSQYKSFVLESEFLVYRGDDVVFAKCCRKHNENPYDFGNFFTARISDLDISRGNVAFGLCESTTWVSGVETPAVRFAPPHSALRDYTDSFGVNTSKRGYALYAAGQLVATNDSALAEVLDYQPETEPLKKDLSFWGTLRATSRMIVPGIAAQQIPHAAGMLDGAYMSSLLGMVNNPAGVINGYVGLSEFPWGLEMYSWLARNHFNGSRAQFLLTEHESQFVAFYGSYLDHDKPVVIDCLTHEFQNDPEFKIKVVDVIKFAGQDFSHAALYQQAFGESAIEEYDVRHESIYRGAVNQDGDPWGYPVFMGGDTGTNDPANYTSYNQHAPFASFYADGERYYSINVLLPRFRVYCDIGGLVPNLLWPEYFALDIPRKAQGAYQPVFLARAVSPVSLED